MATPTQSPPNPANGLWLVGLAILLPMLAISQQSFWIDEASTCWKAQQSSISQWWNELVAERGSDLQMPVYQLFMWLWVKVAGTSEIALRASNLPWFWLGLVAVWRGLAGAPALARAWVLALLVTPLCWYYLNEARPYAMQIGMAAAAIAALWRLNIEQESVPQSRWFWVLCGSVLILSGASMLGMIFGGAYLMAGGLAIGWRKSLQLLRANVFPAAVLLAGSLALGAYFLWTVKSGAGGMRVRADFRNVLFVAYEMLGFSGLGPGRTDMRSGSLRIFVPFAPILTAFAMVVVTVVWLGLRHLARMTPTRVLWSVSIVMGLSVAFLFGVGFILKFRVLGRHFIPILPLVALVIGAGMVEAANWRRAGRWLVATYLLLATISCLQLRWSIRHAKDDYRLAASWAGQMLARGESVWWNAELRGAQVYSVPYSLPGAEPGKVWILANPSPGFAERVIRPDWVIVSKPDVYDIHQAVSAFLATSGYHVERRFPAFAIWKKRP